MKIRPKMMTVKEVGRYLSLSIKTIYRLVEEGTLPAFKIGGQWRFDQDSLDDWILSRMNTEGTKGNKEG